MDLLIVNRWFEVVVVCSLAYKAMVDDMLDSIHGVADSHPYAPVFMQTS